MGKRFFTVYFYKNKKKWAHSPNKKGKFCLIKMIFFFSLSVLFLFSGCVEPVVPRSGFLDVNTFIVSSVAAHVVPLFCASAPFLITTELEIPAACFCSTGGLKGSYEKVTEDRETILQQSLGVPCYS